MNDIAFINRNCASEYKTRVDSPEYEFHVCLSTQDRVMVTAEGRRHYGQLWRSQITWSPQSPVIQPLMKCTNPSGPFRTATTSSPGRRVWCGVLKSAVTTLPWYCRINLHHSPNYNERRGVL